MHLWKKDSCQLATSFPTLATTLALNEVNRIFMPFTLCKFSSPTLQNSKENAPGVRKICEFQRNRRGNAAWQAHYGSLMGRHRQPIDPRRFRSSDDLERRDESGPFFRRMQLRSHSWPTATKFVILTHVENGPVFPETMPPMPTAGVPYRPQFLGPARSRNGKQQPNSPFRVRFAGGLGEGSTLPMIFWPPSLRRFELLGGRF